MSETFSIGLSAEVTQKIRQHGEQTYPHECCGALLGRDWGSRGGESGASNGDATWREVVALFPLVNRREDSPGNRFSVTAQDVREAEESARGQGLGLIGWYHSHPDHPARPSEYDREHAWPWYSYIIVSVQAGGAAELTSWRLRDDRSGFVAEKIGQLQANAAE